ncbi:MAG: hypothetical protein M1812_004529 [Candelaria pacifica]|nr:MAG: hypothetical protein M1812_004529 [Candelaria pacifica]
MAYPPPEKNSDAPYIALSLLHYPLPQTLNFTRTCENLSCAHNSALKTDIANCDLHVWELISFDVLTCRLLPSMSLYGDNKLDQLVLKFQPGGKRLQDLMARFVTRALRHPEYKLFRLKFVVTFDLIAPKNEFDRMILRDEKVAPPAESSAIAVVEKVSSSSPLKSTEALTGGSSLDKQSDPLGPSISTKVEENGLDCGVRHGEKVSSPIASEMVPIAEKAACVSPARSTKRGLDDSESEETDDRGSPPKKTKVDGGTKIDGGALDRLPEGLKLLIMQYAKEG